MEKIDPKSKLWKSDIEFFQAFAKMGGAGPLAICQRIRDRWPAQKKHFDDILANVQKEG